MILVTGATGNIGRPLVATLVANGEKVRAISRGVSPVDVADQVRYVRADLTDPQSLPAAFEGGDALFLLLANDLLGPGTDIAGIVDAARAGGINRIVLLSSQVVGTRPDSVSHAPLRAAEEAVQASGLAWTMLRAGGFASNAYAWAESIRRERMVAAPFADVALPVIDPADIADVAAVVLRDDEHAGRIYELTGPQAITLREQAATLASVVGVELHFVELTREQAAQHMAQFMPPAVVEGTLDILGRPLPAEQQVSPDVHKLLGGSRTFEDWARRNAGAFA